MMTFMIKTLLLLFICVSALADNYSVTFWSVIPPSDPMRVAGAPTNQPYIWINIGSSTNVTPPAILLSADQLATCFATNAAAWSNALVQCNYNVTSNYNAWYSIYTNIPAGMVDSSNRMAALLLNYNSFISGTNTAAGTNAIIKSVINQTYYTFVYLNQMINYLSKLGPGLQQIYNPESDPTRK